MLAFFAALVPIVASLDLGISFLAQCSRQAHDSRVFARVDAWHEEQSGMLDIALLGAAEWERQQNALRDRRALLLRANEVDPTVGTLPRSPSMRPGRRPDPLSTACRSSPSSQCQPHRS